MGVKCYGVGRGVKCNVVGVKCDVVGMGCRV